MITAYLHTQVGWATQVVLLEVGHFRVPRQEGYPKLITPIEGECLVTLRNITE